MVLKNYYRVSCFWVLSCCFLLGGLSKLEAATSNKVFIEYNTELQSSPQEIDLDELNDEESIPLLELKSGSENANPLEHDEVVSAISQSAANTKLKKAHTKTGLVWIRMYLGVSGKRDSKGRTVYPYHQFTEIQKGAPILNRRGKQKRAGILGRLGQGPLMYGPPTKKTVTIQKEFATVSWFSDGQIKEWDAFPISSGSHNPNEIHPTRGTKGAGVWTPHGNFSVSDLMSRYHRSSIYKQKPNSTPNMAWAIDHNGVIKIHVGNVTGKPASHGCIRVPSFHQGYTSVGGVNKGYLLQEIVKKIGKSNVLITIYRSKKTLENEQSPSAILHRMANPVGYHSLNFYRF